MNRRLRKKELRPFEVELARIILRYIRLGPRTHKDIFFKLENELEDLIYPLLGRFLILHPSWPHKERWLDTPIEISWSRNRVSVQAQGSYRYGLLKDIGGYLYYEPLKLNFRFDSKGVFHYSIVFGTHPELFVFSRRPKIPKNLVPWPI